MKLSYKHSSFYRIIFFSLTAVAVVSPSANASLSCEEFIVSTENHGIGYLEKKLSDLEEMERRAEELPTFIGYSGLSVRSINYEKSVLMTRHHELARQLVSQVVDVKSFGLVINYLGKTHPTTFKYDSQPFTLNEVLEKGINYLRSANPGFELGLEMLKQLPSQHSSIASSAIQGYTILSEGVRKIYLYTIENAKTADQVEELLKYFNGYAEKETLVFPGKISVFQDIIQRTKDIIIKSPNRLHINRVDPTEGTLRATVAEINFAKAETPKSFISAIPWIRDTSYFGAKDYTEEYMIKFEPTLKKHIGKFLDMNPSANEILNLFLRIGSSHAHTYLPEVWGGTYLRKFARSFLGTYLSEAGRVESIMAELRASPFSVEDNFGSVRMEVLFMLQNSIPTRLQGVFLAGLPGVIPPNPQLDKLEKLLGFYKNDRLLEDMSNEIRRRYL